MSVVEGPRRVDLFTRIKNMFVSPKTEWEVVEAEPATVQGLYTNYILILAAIPAAIGLLTSLFFASMLGAFGSIFGAVVGLSPVWLIVSAIVNYLLSLVMIFVFALIIEALAPSFGAVKDRIQALKVATFTAAIIWTACIALIIPVLGVLVVLAAAVYACYVFYLGIRQVMHAPEDKAVGYAIVSIVVGIICGFIINMVVNIPLGLVRGAAVIGGAHNAVTVKVPGASVNLNKLEEASKQLQASAEAAQAAAAGGATVSTAVSGDRLQALLPDSLPGGFARTNIESTSGGVAGMQVSNAEATYEKGDGRIKVSITDMGPIGALAGAVNVNSSRSTSSGYEKIQTVNGHMTTEKYDRDSKSGEYGVVAGGHFNVQAEGNNVSIDDLKAAVNAVGINRVEQLAKG